MPEHARPLGFEFTDDPTTLHTLIEMHAPRRNAQLGLSILDCTFSEGRMWRGLDYDVRSLDLNPDLNVDYVGDFRDMRNLRDRSGKPGAIRDQSVDVLVFDPPHRSESAATSVYAGRFGLINAELQHAVDVTFYFEPFLREASRVLARDGVLLAKIGDQVHRNRRRFQPFKFWAAVEDSATLHNCDVRMQGRSRGAFRYAGRQMHLLTNYVCWFVVRRGRRCTRDA